MLDLGRNLHLKILKKLLKIIYNLAFDKNTDTVYNYVVKIKLLKVYNLMA